MYLVLKKLIQSESIYNFPEDHGLSEALNQAFPECSRTHCKSNNNSSSAMCSDKAALVERLRKAAFLNPQNKELWRNLACVYASGGFIENSKGIMSFYQALSGKTYAQKGDQYCYVDEDCTFVPVCNNGRTKICDPETGLICHEDKKNICYHINNQVICKKLDSSNLIPMNKDMAEIYHLENCLNENTLCNNKCRCGNKEEIKVFSDGGDFGGSTGGTSGFVGGSTTTGGEHGFVGGSTTTGGASDFSADTTDVVDFGDSTTTDSEDGFSNIGIVSHNAYQSKCINFQCVKVDIPISPEPVKKTPLKPILNPIKEKNSGSVQ